jgi:hypothetical protein
VPRAADTLDFTEPIALVLLGITAHIVDDIVGRLPGARPSGSHLVLCDGTEVLDPEAMRTMIEQWNEAGDTPRVNRAPEQLARFFDGLDLLDPGVVSLSRWRPGPGAAEARRSTASGEWGASRNGRPVNYLSYATRC